MTSERDHSAASRAPRLPLIGVAASLATVAFIMVVNVVFLLHGQVGSMAFSLVPTLLILDMSLVGGLLAIRRRDNAIGPVLLGAGLFTALSFGSGYYENLNVLIGQGHLPFVVLVAWIGNWTFVPAIGLMVIVLPLLFATAANPPPPGQAARCRRRSLRGCR